MPDETFGPRRRMDGHASEAETTAVLRHVGPTLEADNQFVPSGELPENQIANEAGDEAVDVSETPRDPLDREAEAMGAERLKTRLPGDKDSDPHTDLGGDNATNLDSDKGKKGGKAA